MCVISIEIFVSLQSCLRKRGQNYQHSLLSEVFANTLFQFVVTSLCIDLMSRTSKKFQLSPLIFTSSISNLHTPFKLVTFKYVNIVIIFCMYCHIQKVYIKLD